MNNSNKAQEKISRNVVQRNETSSEGSNAVQVTVEGQGQGRPKECRYIMVPNSTFGQLGELSSDDNKINALVKKDVKPEKKIEPSGKLENTASNDLGNENTENEEDNVVNYPLERKRGVVFYW